METEVKEIQEKIVSAENPDITAPDGWQPVIMGSCATGVPMPVPTSPEHRVSSIRPTSGSYAYPVPQGLTLVHHKIITNHC